MGANEERAGCDFARVEHREDWLSHPVYGDPSFDAFVRNPGNPICRGTAGLEWPVNGFLFLDPVSGRWYLYVGHYPTGYAAGPGHAPAVCTVFRSSDAGRTWEPLGPIFGPTPFCFRGDSSPVTFAPDVSVVYTDGRYHMAYDWALEGSTWENIRSSRSGVGYAWSDRPEGPFERFAEPIVRNDVPATNPVLGKYNRFYAATLIRRKSDWMVLILMDGGPHFAWGLVALTAERPEGPYGNLTPLFHVEGDGYQPPLMEYFPAFVHDGWIYAPSTSVALNRDFQMIQRARVEEALRPEAWELVQHGSVWHGANLEHEAQGMWGQTFSGFVDAQGQLQMMFPSKDKANKGTINLASRAWDRPYGERGFHISGHGGPSLALLKRSYAEFELECRVAVSGAAWLFWGNTAPLGPNAPSSDATLHSLAWPRGDALRLDGSSWQLLRMAGETEADIVASGTWDGKPEHAVTVERRANGDLRLAADERMLWAGTLPEWSAGTMGILAGKESYVSVNRFAVKGMPAAAVLTYLHTEGLLGAGQGFVGWQEVASPGFRYGVGAVHGAAGGREKWNFAGTGFTLWAPKGPEYGRVEVLVDGRTAGNVDLFDASLCPSQPVLRAGGLAEGFHAVVLRGLSGRLVLDSLDVS